MIVNHDIDYALGLYPTSTNARCVIENIVRRVLVECIGEDGDLKAEITPDGEMHIIFPAGEQSPRVQTREKFINLFRSYLNTKTRRYGRDTYNLLFRDMYDYYDDSTEYYHSVAVTRVQLAIVAEAIMHPDTARDTFEAIATEIENRNLVHAKSQARQIRNALQRIVSHKRDPIETELTVARKAEMKRLKLARKAILDKVSGEWHRKLAADDAKSLQDWKAKSEPLDKQISELRNQLTAMRRKHDAADMKRRKEHYAMRNKACCDATADIDAKIKDLKSLAQ